MTTMRFSDLFDPDLIELGLRATSRNEIIREVVALLGLADESAERLFQMLRRRQNLGSTAFGRGVAILYTRSRDIDRVRLGYGRQPDGIEFGAMDGESVYHFFLAFAPPLETSNQFLPVLGKIGECAEDPAMMERLSQVETRDQFLELMGTMEITVRPVNT